MTTPHILTYYSSRTEDLLAALLRQLDSDETSPIHLPFGRAQILVPNSGMQRYIELKIAEHFGICSHIDINYVGQLVTKTYRGLLDNDSPAHLDERLLTFALLQLWDKQQIPLDSAFNRLHQQHNQPHQRYLWARKIAALLCHYLNERPEMIDAWQQGKMLTTQPHEAWQRDIFLKLLDSLGIRYMSRLALQKRFIDSLEKIPQHDLPTVIHVFGFHAIPVAQLTDLIAIGQVTSVVFYTFNPCIEYWQDIVPEKVKARLEITQADEAELMSVGHPLLASWGQAGKYYIEQLNEHYAPNLDTIVEPEKPTSLLTWLQNDIRKLRADSTELGNLFAKEKTPSISLHACANPRREVEVLYDNLCELFDDSDLNPADVLVIVPKLGEYAPHIQAIFSRLPQTSHHIPYSLANQSSAESEPDVQAFLALLNVFDGEFQAQLLFEVLSEARIQQALNLSQSHLDSLRSWFANSRFSRHFYDDSNGESSSLEKLLDSLLLAAVGGEDAELGNRHASPHYHGGQQEALTQLCALWQRFVPFVSLKHQSLTLSKWRDKLRHLCEVFLPARHTMDDRLNDWFDVLAELDDNKTTYDFTTIIADLSALLQGNTLHGPFLSGGVSFCAVVPMRGVPAKMIAVLGLNSDFPAITAKDPLDLRLAKPLWSDRNPHKEQQYFFLETLMAAREKLYLSHIGLNEKTGEHIPPSALVRELFGYLERHLPKLENTLTRTYPLQGFFSDQSYQSLYNTIDTKPPSYDCSPATENKVVDLPESLTTTQLADAIYQPFSAFLRLNLGAADLDNIAEPLAKTEFFAADSGLDKWHYKASALAIARNDNTAITALQQANLYAPKTISDALLAHAADDVQSLVEQLNALNLTSTPIRINATLKHTFAGKPCYLRLNAENHPTVGLLTYHVGKMDAKKVLRAWTAHVVYHCLADNKPGQSHLLTVDGNVTFRAFDNPAAAKSELDKLLTLLNTLIQQPYPATLKKKGKKMTLTYERSDYSLYPEIGTPDASVADTLQTFWSPINEAMVAQQ